MRKADYAELARILAGTVRVAICLKSEAKDEQARARLDERVITALDIARAFANVAHVDKVAFMAHINKAADDAMRR